MEDRFEAARSARVDYEERHIPLSIIGRRETRVSSPNADRFKSKAEGCRRLAAQAASEEGKNAWLRLADEWERLAEHAFQGRGIFDRYE